MRGVQRLFELLREHANVGGDQLLSGRYGVTQSFMEIKLWRDEPKKARDGLSFREMPRTAVSIQTSAVGDYSTDVEQRASSVWLAYIQPLLLAGKCAHLADMRRLCSLRDEIVREGASKPDNDGSYSLPEEVWGVVRSDFDRRGRRIYLLSNLLPGAVDWVRQFLTDMPTAETLKSYQRAALAVIERNGQAVHEDDLSPVDPADLLHEPTDDASLDALPPY